MELNKENQAQLDAIIKQTGDQSDDKYMAAQYKAVEEALTSNQKVGEAAQARQDAAVSQAQEHRAAVSIAMSRQISLAAALRTYKREQ